MTTNGIEPNINILKKLDVSILFFILFNFSFSQNMNNDKLQELFIEASDSIQGTKGRWQFNIKEVTFICLTDETHNRMRIISPIIESFKLTEELKTNALLANFHTALDVKYAISDDVLWSVFIHPLKELTEAQINDALQQVYFANVTFGTTYSSTSLVFPGKTNNEPSKEKKEEFTKQKI